MLTYLIVQPAAYPRAQPVQGGDKHIVKNENPAGDLAGFSDGRDAHEHLGGMLIR